MPTRVELSQRIAVLGTGPVGLGSAALLLSRGHVPVPWSPRGMAPGRLMADGALEVVADVDAAPELAHAVAGADAVLVAVPATAYRAVLEPLAAVLRPGQPVLISGHLSFAALFLSGLLAARGVSVPIAAWGTTAVSGRRTGPGVVRVSSVRAEVDMAAVRDGDADALVALCRTLFGDRFRLRAGLLAVALSNVNPQNHLAIALCNFTRIERGEAWGQNTNITPAVGRLMEALDAERLAIAAAAGVEVRTLRRHFHLSFHVPEAPLHEMAAALKARGNDPDAPRTPRTRYVEEDAPFGLHPTALLGRMLGCPAPLHEAGLLTLSAMYGRDLASDNDIMDDVMPALRHLVDGGTTT